MAFENFREYKYHFTSCEGLYGMLKGYSEDNPHLTMWATHSSFMNDSSEYEYGKEMCVKVLKQYEKQKQIPSEQSIFKRGKTPLEDVLSNDAPFLISLSGNIESAAMWSMYSSNGSGIALKFDVATLQKYSLINKHETIQPTGCIYSKTAGDILKDYSMYVEFFYKMLSNVIYKKNENNGLQDMFLKDFASQIKHSSFAYEDEHRIIVSGENKTLLFRVRNNIITPYIEVEIPIDSLHGIIIGPTANFEYTKKSLEVFLRSLDSKSTAINRIIKNIKSSEVPYRG